MQSANINLNLMYAGNVTSLVVPVAALGAVGYGYMWWKVQIQIQYSSFSQYFN